MDMLVRRIAGTRTCPAAGARIQRCNNVNLVGDVGATLELSRLVLLRPRFPGVRTRRAAAPRDALPLRRRARPLARRHQPARHGARLYDPAVAHSARGLQLCDPEDLRRARRPAARRLRAVQRTWPSRRRRADFTRHGVRQQRQRRGPRLRRIRAARMDAGRHDQEGRGQLQFSLASPASAQLRPAGERIPDPDRGRSSHPGGLHRDVAPCSGECSVARARALAARRHPHRHRREAGSVRHGERVLYRALPLRAEHARTLAALR